MKNITDTQKNENKETVKFPIDVKNVFPKHRQQVLNEYGWGFRDCYFVYENDYLVLKGKR